MTDRQVALPTGIVRALDTVDGSPNLAASVLLPAGSSLWINNDDAAPGSEALALCHVLVIEA